MNESATNEIQRDAREDGQITYANEVIATIVTVATTEVEGISGIVGGTPISGILGSKSKLPKGLRLDANNGVVSVDVSVTVDYGIPIQKVGRNVQENIRKSVETMTGMQVKKVDLHVVGVSFEKENQELQAGQKLASMSIDEEQPATAEATEKPAEQEEAAKQTADGETEAAEMKTDDTAIPEEDVQEDAQPEADENAGGCAEMK